LWDAGVPIGPVNSIPEVFEDPQVKHRQVVVETPHAGMPSGVVRTIKPPATLHDTPGDVRRPPPLKGEHTREVLAELGYATGEIDSLLASGVAFAHSGDAAGRVAADASNAVQSGTLAACRGG
jgi:crotonobetainyl-CoA:carnitine CoA-transferase CaiB-like acyl-CoA transferase